MENNTQRVGATTKFLAPTNARGSRIKVTMAGRSRTVSYDYAARSAHAQAVQDAWEFFGFGPLADVTYVADSESGRGSVYVVTYGEGVTE